MSYRVQLPDNVVPSHYDLSLSPNLKDFIFNGTVVISISVRSPTSRIQLNSRDLVIFSASCDGIDAVIIELNTKEMTLTLGFDKAIEVGEHKLKIVFQGTHNDLMSGFYRSSYKSGNETKYMACTQFEAIDARRAFPCWDEPARKAVFDVTITADSELTALSNMPEASVSRLPNGKTVTKFLPTPIMSTYLVAFVVGEFEFIQSLTSSGTLVRVLCVPGKVNQCEYALQVATRALEFYNDFFGIPYPLPKCDHIAIPDFSAGAMENWGLITYREVALLCDKNITAALQERVCSVIAHELAHQWFGNLVTMTWWDDLWLNEGFANWMQTFTTDFLHPEWKVWEGYISQEMSNALMLDALRSSHPIQVPIGRAESVEEVFDVVSYCKGGSVVRMIYAVLGHQKFREGLQLYMGRHRFSNTETTDLWRAWEEVSGVPIAAMMSTWTEKMGFPVVTVKEGSSAGGKLTLSVSQEYFLADGSKQPGDEDQTWVVPIICSSKSAGAQGVQFLRTKQGSVEVAANPGDWVLLNSQRHCLYRVLYPESMIMRLAQSVHELTVEDRIGLIGDAYALAKSGHTQPTVVLQLLAGFRSERSSKVWGEIASVTGGLGRILKSVNMGDKFVPFMKELISPIVQHVGFSSNPGDSHETNKLRQVCLQLAAGYAYDTAFCKEQAASKFKAFLADASTVDANARAPVFSIMLKNEPRSTWEELRRYHNEVATDGGLKGDIYISVGQARDPAVKLEILNWLLTEDVRAQNFREVLHGVATSENGEHLAFEWLGRNYDFVYDRVGKASMILFNHIPRCTGACFNTQQEADMVESFWASKKLDSLARTIQQVVENIRGNATFRDRVLASGVMSEQFWATLRGSSNL